jgi:hypothetical protein
MSRGRFQNGPACSGVRILVELFKKQEKGILVEEG